MSLYLSFHIVYKTVPLSINVKILNLVRYDLKMQELCIAVEVEKGQCDCFLSVSPSIMLLRY